MYTFFVRRFLSEASEDFAATANGPRSRSGTSAPTIFKLRRLSVPILDVAVVLHAPSPAPSPVDIEENGIGPRRLTFDHVEFPDASSPAFVGRQSACAETDRVLRPTVPKTPDFLTSEAHAQRLEAVAIAGEFNFESIMYTRVLSKANREVSALEKRPLMQLANSFRSKRSIEDVSVCAHGLGHDLTYLGLAGNGAGGKFSWLVSLNTFGLVPALKDGLAFFNMVATVEIWSRGADLKREWCARSEYMGLDDMRKLLEALVCGPLPAPPIHKDFSGVLPKAFASVHPWVVESHGTSLSKEPPKMLSPGTEIVFASVSSLAVVADGRRCCSKKCSFSVHCSVGVEATGEFFCSTCKKVHVIPLFAGQRSVLNHTAYVAQMMSGRPKAVSRFLQLLSLPKIPHRGSDGTFIDLLWRATEAVYLECSKIVMEYFVLSDMATASLDAFHKRMAKAFTVLGESFSTGVSIADPRIRKVLFVFFYGAARLGRTPSCEGRRRDFVSVSCSRKGSSDHDAGRN